VTYDLTLRNTGTAPAADLRGDVVAIAGGTVLAGAAIGGAPAIDLAPGASHVHRVVVTVTGACGEAVDVDVTNLRAGTTTFTRRSRAATWPSAPTSRAAARCGATRPRRRSRSTRRSCSAP